jgi:CDGSH-type Zn-finger protein
MTEKAKPRVVVSKDGPYFVFGRLPIALQTIVPNKQQMSWEWEEGRSFPSAEEVHLCRCGHSSHKPFCDGTHKKVGFVGTETASRVPYEKQSEVSDGPTMTLRDQENLCAFARFCDPGGKIWSLIERTDEPEARELVAREGMHCPSGRLVVHDKKSGKVLEPELPASVGIVEDPALGVSGPLWVRGGVTVESPDGTKYEVRNRVTLCRCGQSTNKPFCDGSHASIKFQDGLSNR